MEKSKLKGSIEVPGDKAVSHRALIFSVFSKGLSSINNLSPAEDCMSTIACLRQLGADIVIEKSNNGHKGRKAFIKGKGIASLIAPEEILFAGNSGTTMRLLSGLVAGRKFTATFDGDNSLRRRPMARVLDHLKTMGATITYEDGQGLAPFAISGGDLQGAEFQLPVASAQVQTALLLAGLQASGKTKVILPGPARDHTARMFTYIGVPFEEKNGEHSISIKQLSEPTEPFVYEVMGDISSAAFFMVAAACLPGSDITLTNVGVNKGRTLVIDVLKKMGADITVMNETEKSGEPVADIRIKGDKSLRGTNVSGSEIARGVDEIPVLALAGALCEGEFSVSDATELRHKESDRLKLITDNLKAAGAQIKESEDGFVITGKKNIAGGSPWQTVLDHRLAMTGLVANLLFDNPLTIEETESTAVSYPSFAEDLKVLCQS